MKKDSGWEKELQKREIVAELQSLADQKYQKFSSSLLPGTKGILGVRIPNLRKIAQKLAKEDWKKALKILGDDCFEEVLLHGLVIGYAKASPEEILEALENFVPKVDNWSVCDSTIMTLKIVRKYPGTFFSYARECIDNGMEFSVRFGLVMMLDYFVDDGHITSVLASVDDALLDGYYAKMAAAWAVSVCYVKYPEITYEWLLHTKIDDWTFNKSIQKIKESYRVSEEDKKQLSHLSRI